MDGLITRAFIGGQSLANLDICGCITADVAQTTSFPSNAKYGCIIAVGGLVPSFPIWFKCGITGRIKIGSSGSSSTKIAEVNIDVSSVKTTDQDITIVWYG